MTFRTLIGALGMMAVCVLAPARAEALLLTVEDFTVIIGGGPTDVTATVEWEVGDPDPLSLDGFNVTLAPGLIVDATPFFATWPLALSAPGSYTGVLFTVTAILGAPLGVTPGTATFFASGASGPIQDTTDGFTATVAPEPTSLLLLGSGLLGAGFLRRRHRARQ